MSSGSDDDRDIVAAAAAAAEQFNHDNHENLSSDEGRNTGIKPGRRGHLALNFNSPQSFIITFSYSLT